MFLEALFDVGSLKNRSVVINTVKQFTKALNNLYLYSGIFIEATKLKKTTCKFIKKNTSSKITYILTLTRNVTQTGFNT